MPLHKTWFWTITLCGLVEFRLTTLSAQGLPPLDSASVTVPEFQHLQRLTIPHLLALLTDDSLTYTSGLGEPDSNQLAVAYELARRKPYDALCRALAHPLDIYRQPKWIAATIEQVRSPEADSCMKGLATSDSSYTTYFAVRYFARTGQEWALTYLNDNLWKYHLFAFDLQDAIQLFHRYRYRPAARHLAEAMGAFNMTTVGEAEDALRALFPAVDTTFTDPSEAHAFWVQYVATHPQDQPNQP
jgi:hypothetical protein